MKKIDSFYMSDKQIEEMKRAKKLDKKMVTAGKLILISLASILTFGVVPEILTSMGAPVLSDLVSGITLGTSSITGILGFCKFASDLHQPLDEKEAEELKHRDAIEKGGRRK